MLCNNGNMESLGKRRIPNEPVYLPLLASVLEQRVLPRSGLDGQRWQGWHIDKGKLVTPQGEYLSAASIESQTEQLKQMRSVCRQANRVRELANNGLAEAGEIWHGRHGWQFKGGFLISPDERKIAPDELYVVMVGHDAMETAKHRPKSVPSYPETDVIAIGTKCT